MDLNPEIVSTADVPGGFGPGTRISPWKDVAAKVKALEPGMAIRINIAHLKTNNLPAAVGSAMNRFLGRGVVLVRVVGQHAYITRKNGNGAA